MTQNETDRLLQLVADHSAADAVQHAELKAAMARNMELITLLRIDVAGLKVKAGVWGAIAGVIPVLIVLGGLWIKAQ